MPHTSPRLQAEKGESASYQGRKQQIDEGCNTSRRHHESVGNTKSDASLDLKSE